MTAAIHTEESYRDLLIAKGLDQAQAQELARTYAINKTLPNVDQGEQEAEGQEEDAQVIGPAPYKAPTASEKKLIEASAQILEAGPENEDMAFMHSILCQVGLPRSKVAGLEFERVCGAAGVHIRAGKLWEGHGFIQQQIPYGAMPRLIMAHINTFALRNKTPEIEMGSSANDMLRRLGKSTNGGAKGALTTFKAQTKALAACSITLGFNKAGSSFSYDGKPIKQFEAWLSTNDQQPALWPGVITLSDDYYKTLTDHAVPLDLRAMMALKGSALAMDIYTMFAERLHRIGPRPLLLHWKSLRDQFGQEYTGANAHKDFKNTFLNALKMVTAVYPTAEVRQVNGGILMQASPPPVPYRITQ